MIKQIEIHGQCFEPYSPDEGRIWSSSPQSIVAYGRRKRNLRMELQKRFELIRSTEGLDTINSPDLRLQRASESKGKKIMNGFTAAVPAHSIQGVRAVKDDVRVATAEVAKPKSIPEITGAVQIAAHRSNTRHRHYPGSACHRCRCFDPDGSVSGSAEWKARTLGASLEIL